MEILGRLDTWIFWALYATGILIMATVLVIDLHINKNNDLPPRLLATAAFLATLGCIWGGIQAGPHPIESAQNGVAHVRIFLAGAAVLGTVAALLHLWNQKPPKEP